MSKSKQRAKADHANASMAWDRFMSEWIIYQIKNNPKIMTPHYFTKDPVEKMIYQFVKRIQAEKNEPEVVVVEPK